MFVFVSRDRQSIAKILEWAFEKSTDAIFLLGTEGFIDCNQASVELFGYSHKSQLVNISPSDISPAFQPDGQSSVEKANAMISQALEVGSHQFELMYQRANREVFWADVVLTAIFYDGTQMLHSLIRDISDRKAYEEHLEKNNSELIHATRMKDEFLATMSHELRTPKGEVTLTSELGVGSCFEIVLPLQLFQSGDDFAV